MTLFGLPWDGVFAASVVAATAALATLAWTIRAWYLTRSHANALADKQIAAQKDLLDLQLQSQKPVDARGQFMERLEWAAHLAESASPTEQFLGLEMLKRLVVAPWATAADRDYALQIATKIGIE
ncbi:hypothetical protein JF66_17320 [Cryobacterium sp. MLB-32]|uniref:hypothetical protein n=1 Tax=Cryobacterium sp. MLB-32 TaxID=1529318 RepID=UPI0004E69856|nr:hypothetical protein [Cryobacterium sp. MLB-32]KFF58605.1 hypothetical protein JF66_17320 [Cryobacterium sp. MLB-32]